MFAGCASVGVLFTPVTVIVKLFVSFVAKDVAVTDAASVTQDTEELSKWISHVRASPACALSVLVRNVGPVLVNVIASPSGSVARSEERGVGKECRFRLCRSA